MLLMVILCFFNVFFMLKINTKAILSLENVRGKGYNNDNDGDQIKGAALP